VKKLAVTVLTIMIGGLMLLVAGCTPEANPAGKTSSPPEAGPAVRLVFTAQPGGAVAGATLGTQPAVAVVDAGGDIVTDYRGFVVLAITEGTGSSRENLFGGTQIGVVNGRVEFKDISIARAGDDYTLTVTSGSLEPATSEPFAIEAGEPYQLSFTTHPSDGVAGSPLATQPEVTVLDYYGNKVTSYQGSVTLAAFLNNEETSVRTEILGTVTAPVVKGVASFTDIYFELAIPGYNLRAAGGSLEIASSKSFTIEPAEPTGLIVSVHPEGAAAGTPFETQPKVAVLDSYGNVVSDTGISITISITPGTGTAGAVLSGTTTLVADDGLGGLAVFRDLAIDKAGSGYTLTATTSDMASATSSGLTSATSQAFDVTAP